MLPRMAVCGKLDSNKVKRHVAPPNCELETSIQRQECNRLGQTPDPGSLEVSLLHPARTTPGKRRSQRALQHSSSDSRASRSSEPNMMSSTGAQRVPAWKRLGLQLKPAADGPETGTGRTPAVGHRGSTQHDSHSSKRKLEAPPAAAESAASNKKARRESHTTNGTKAQQLQKKVKSVTFGDTPTKASAGEGPKQKKQAKKNKGPAKKQKPAAPADFGPALEYLRQWKSSRSSWKFNKNHQSTLINHVFDADGIPAADVATFYEYIRDLKGFVRTRLQETAMDVRTADTTRQGSAFPAGTTDLEAKQMGYEKLLGDLLLTQQPGQKRKGFNEAEYIAASKDADVLIRRLVKRMRAEMIIDELSDAEQTDGSEMTQSSRTMTNSDTNTTTADGPDKRLRLNDGSGKRRRKLRVNLDDSSSSESESDSDSDTSSAGSSDDSASDSSESESESESDDASDDGEEADPTSVGADESSSSESSSSSEEEDESDSDGSDDSDDESASR
ncbi:uncharacterized protein DCS_02116 [Drechmeria coniospora]|uniref:WKF domain-containing protein n=1 Tax=Drechmeria coniospora TaxID=98403 RepID=A0A151GV39_DRECN|nr:uncharacterized protein DCS_02116 [Drechmeria coniospora]KYK60976.1 uncharacterized protein DCS_02116 [Drechmeria coniospora]